MHFVDQRNVFAPKDVCVFKMPIGVDAYLPGQNKPETEKVQNDATSNDFTINVTDQPEEVVLDPRTWVLMDADFVRLVRAPEIRPDGVSAVITRTK
jgi:hypothetical protein